MPALTQQRVICVFTDTYTDYQQILIDKIVADFKPAGYGVLCIAGRDLDPPTKGYNLSYKASNLIYQKARHYNVAGWIILSGTIGHNITRTELTKFVHQFADRPLVSLGVDIPSVSSVIVENRKSMTDLMHHMTSDPARKHFAFIRGYKNNPDSIEREQVFRQILAQKGIDVDEDLIVEGNFVTSESFNVINNLLHRTHQIDAIIAANDEMASSAVLALDQHGLRIPDDVLVSGFDDRPIASETSPPLTTVKQSLESAVHVATRHLMDQIINWTGTRQAAQTKYIASELIVRASSSPMQSSDSLELTAQSITDQSAVQELIDRIKSQFEKVKYQQLQEKMHLRFASCMDLGDLGRAMDLSTKELGLKRFYCVLYEVPGVMPDTMARVLFSHPSNDDKSESDEFFSSKYVLPETSVGELTSGILVQYPLCPGETHFGYLLIDPSDLPNLNIEGMARGISNAVRHCTLLDDLKTQAEDLREVNRELAKVANYDVLTGLPNRALFQSELERSFFDAEQDSTEVALLFFDLDGFKRINDTLGHSAGDYLLRIVAKRLSKVLFNIGSLARLGGDEFTLILNGVHGTTVSSRIAERILDTLRRPYKLGDRVVNLSASIGIAHYPGDGTDVETLVKHADTAMYHAKSLGKNCYHYYTQDLNRQAIAHLQLEHDMRQGLLSDEFCMHYQPRYDLSNNKMVAFEALMRWNAPPNSDYPNGIGPDVFIPLAEQSSLINEFDTFALDQACHQATIWEKSGSPIVVSVNLSVKQLQQDTIVEIVQKTIDRHKLDPKWLELEITETAAMTDVERNIQKLTQLRDIGIKISIDDFGTGYSSLNYLKQLPVTNLKIDKSFLNEITSIEGGNSPDAAIVRAVVALGKSMNFRLIAEGIETEEQLAFLISLGCDEAQGYLFGRPLDVATATTLLEGGFRYSKAA